MFSGCFGPRAALRAQVTRNLKEIQSKSDGFGVDIFVLKDEDVSYALGKGGSTRMKLETASGCAASRHRIMYYIATFRAFKGFFRYT